MLYRTGLLILLTVPHGAPFSFGLPFRAVRAVLLEWFRAAELSCRPRRHARGARPEDRLPHADGARRWLSADKLNLDAFMAQAMEYEAWDDPSDRVRRFFAEIGRTHPYSVRRVSEVLKWVQSGEYDRIQRGEYRRRDQQADVREEAGDAVDFYAERFRAIFREMGENITTLGNQIGGVAEQVADWIRTRSGGPGDG